MKKRNFAVLICFVVIGAVAAWSHLAAARNPPSVGPFVVEVDPVLATAATGTGLNYSTGFELNEGFPLGYISNTPGTYPAGCGGAAFPCWGHTAAANASLITPTIENLHPASGLQHLRLTRDPTTRTNIPNWGLGVDARYPRTSDLSVRPVAPNTVSLDIAISNSGGMNYRIQPQSNSQGYPATSALFFYTGEIYILNCVNDVLVFQPTGVLWDSTGSYQNFTVAMDPCGGDGYGYGGTVNYYYAGNLILTGCIYAGTNLEQFLVFGDNYPGSYIDVDNLVMTSLDECPHACGNGIIEQGFEECEVTPGGNANCPGRCIAAGQPGECTCTPICTLESPCPVQNGENGPFISSEGHYVYSGTSPYVSVDACGSDFDGSLRLETSSTTLITNDNCQQFGSSGTNSDPSSPCYVPSGTQPDPCTCVPNPNEPILISLFLTSYSYTPSLGSVSYVNIRKKAACAGASVGACCDTNGADRGCTDNVTETNCTGPDKIWTDQGKCVDQQCDCIPDCTGRICGSDGCGGSCGTCGDGNACNGVETCNTGGQCDAGAPLNCDDGDACTVFERCDPAFGCVPGIPLVCDDGLFCDGEEFCVPVYGCQAGTPPCSEGETCEEDADQCVPSSIPTVSQWGLIVLTIVLLVAAKVRFGRAERAS